MFNYIGNNWTTTNASTSATIITISSAGTSTGTVYATTAVTGWAAPLPLREPFIEASPGWLSPEGDYFPVNYPQGQRHDQIAAAIITKFNFGNPDMLNDQGILLSLGWIRVDYDEILPKEAKSTRQQRDTLRQLLTTQDDLRWKQAKELIQRYVFKQSRKKKKNEA